MGAKAGITNFSKIERCFLLMKSKKNLYSSTGFSLLLGLIF